jgi:hypothetical protein
MITFVLTHAHLYTYTPDILGCEVIKATGEWAEKGLVKLRGRLVCRCV